MADSPRALGLDTDCIDVETPHGLGRLHIDWHQTRRSRGIVFLGHGAGGGVESGDLRTLAAYLPTDGYDVVRVEMPWRVAGKKVAPRPAVLDVCWLSLVQTFTDQNAGSSTLIFGGRSAGARVACRTALHPGHPGATSVVALAFPLHPPGRPDLSRRDELPTALPTLIVQGDRDAFGVAAQFAPTQPNWTLAPVPGADHSFGQRRTGPVTTTESHELVAEHVSRWLRARDETEPTRRGIGRPAAALKAS